MNQIEYEILPMERNVSEVLNNNKFISKNIKNHIQNNNFTTYFIKLINNNDIHLYYTPCYHKKNIITLEKNNINSILYRILEMKKLAKIEGKDHGKLIIFIWPTKFNKTINNNEVLGINNVNSGSCDIPYNKNGMIYIWRNEEMNKVLVHELIHALRIDDHLDNNYLDPLISKKFNVHENINTSEAYTETMATFLDSIFKSQENGKNFKDILNKNQNHSIKQSNKVLNIGYKNGEYKQKTSVLSYYVLKSGLLNYGLDRLLSKSKMSNEEFYELILDSMEKWINKNDGEMDNSESLRMTI